MNDSRSHDARDLVPYEPNPLLGWLYDRFFSSIEVDETWAARVRESAARGTVVYVLRNLSFIDFFALDYLVKRLGLPEIRFANDLGLWVLEPMGRGWTRALRPRTEQEEVAHLRRALEAGRSAALFLKRPPRLTDRIERQGGARGQSEGDAYIAALIEMQQRREVPILLVPQVFLWTKRGDEIRQTWLDAALGPREWPGKIRAVSQLLASYGGVTLRAGDPLELRAFLESEGAETPRDVLVRRLTYALLRRLERERRAVVGPARKPADRLREEVLRSPKLLKIVGDLAGEGTAERRVLASKAEAMLTELEATLDDDTMQLLDRAWGATVARMYSAIEVDQEGMARIREAAKQGTVILLPSHKSHVDYLIMTKVLYDHHMQVPLVAAGDNLSFFPLGPVLRRAGAFFIRRNFSGDRLYGALVDAYMRRLVKDGWTLEFFLEGGRSRTGKLLSPKLGLLSIVVDAALAAPERKVFFVPVSIAYERVVEEGAYVEELAGGEKAKEDMGGLLRSARLALGRYGRLSVQVGEILTLEDVLREIAPEAALGAMSPARRRAVITRLAHRVMNEINRVTAVTPGALVATALLTHGGRGLTHEDLIERCKTLARTLHASGARFSAALSHPSDPEGVRVEALRDACDLFCKAGHVFAQRPSDLLAGKRLSRRKSLRAGPDVVYVVPEAGRMPLDISKNLIVHFFIDRALVSNALLASPGPPRELGALKERVQSLSRLFKYEFSFRADASFDTIYADTIRAMLDAGELELTPAGARPTDHARGTITLYARILASFLEGYRAAARSLSLLLRGPLAPRELAKKALPLGLKMHLQGDVQRREAISQALFENAYHAFVDLGYLQRKDGKLTLPASYATEDALGTIEGKLAALLA